MMTLKPDLSVCFLALGLQGAAILEKKKTMVKVGTRSVMQELKRKRRRKEKKEDKRGWKGERERERAVQSAT